MDLNAVLAFAVCLHWLSGGNSTMRKIVPLSGGSVLILPVAASALPELDAGDVFVRHTSVRATPGIDAISRIFGARPSETKIDFPFLSCPVTTRRIRWTMISSLFSFYVELIFRLVLA